MEREEARKHKTAEKEEAKKRKRAEEEKARKQKSVTKTRQQSARQRHVTESSNSSSESDAAMTCGSSSEGEVNTPRPKRQHQLPARFRGDSDSSDSSTDDGVRCTICHSREPSNCTAKTIFLVDCEKCGVWVHSYCVFKNNSISRRYTCEMCCQSSQ